MLSILGDTYMTAVGFRPLSRCGCSAADPFRARQPSFDWAASAWSAVRSAIALQTTRKQLHELDDRQLRDIGLERDMIESLELDQIRRRRF